MYRDARQLVRPPSCVKQEGWSVRGTRNVAIAQALNILDCESDGTGAGNAPQGIVELVKATSWVQTQNRKLTFKSSNTLVFLGRNVKDAFDRDAYCAKCFAFALCPARQSTWHFHVFQLCTIMKVC